MSATDPATDAATQVDLFGQIESCAFAFRGYNVTNHGRSRELLCHPAYGAIVSDALREASEVCADTLRCKCDLAENIRQETASSLATFAEDVSLIVAMEVAQIRLLEEFHRVEYKQAALAFGYSVGEITALVCGGVVPMAQALRPLLAMSPDCAALGADVSMGVIFCRGAELDVDAIHRLCQEITCEGNGIAAVSAQLAPNAVLVLGQHQTIDRFKFSLAEKAPGAHLRKNPNQWPPLHTPILWERCIPDRASLMMARTPFRLAAPRPPIFSLATGQVDYNDFNHRDHIRRWIDSPQLLWDALEYTLSSKVTTLIHVGPEPNLVPATFQRIAENVRAIAGNYWYHNLGLRAIASMVKPWVTRWISSRSSLLRAPFIEHVVLEDWLLSRDV